MTEAEIERKKMIDEFLADRKEAGKSLDPDSAELEFIYLYTDYRDSYPGLREPNETEYPCRTDYVASAETNGWVAYEDLPEETLYRLAERFGWSSYRRPTDADRNKRAALEEMDKKRWEDFYGQILKYLRSESVDYRPGTWGMRYLEIAKILVAEDPELLLQPNKDKLFDAIRKREPVMLECADLVVGQYGPF